MSTALDDLAVQRYSLYRSVSLSLDASRVVRERCAGQSVALSAVKITNRPEDTHTRYSAVPPCTAPIPPTERN